MPLVCYNISMFETYLRLFLVFTKVALFSWGGGPASLALMQREVVAEGWTTPDDFATAIALSNAMPGPTAPQASAYVGYKVAGIWGAIFAVTGTVIPTTILVLILIAGFFSIKDNPSLLAMLKAVRPFVVGLLAFVAFDMFRTVWGVEKLGVGKALALGWDKALIAGVTFFVLVYTNVSPVWLVIAAAGIGLLVYR
jgi:chromate transporter